MPYHTIAFQFAGHAPNDLVVPLWSVHLNGAASEAIFPGFHGSEQGPAAMGEMAASCWNTWPGLEHPGRGLVPHALHKRSIFCTRETCRVCKVRVTERHAAWHENHGGVETHPRRDERLIHRQGG